MKRLVIACLSVMTIGSLYAAESPKAAPPGPRANFNALLEKVKANPADQTVRRQMVEAAAKLNPKPAIPKEAMRHFVMATTFQKEAKTADDYALAVKSYEDALAIAPWWPEANYNLSVALESAGRFADAKAPLVLYLLTKPNDAEAAEKRLYALDAKETLAARESNFRIVPGKSVGAIALGMTAEELRRVAGEPKNVGPTGIGQYLDGTLGVAISGKTHLVTHILALKDTFSTADGLKIGSARTEVAANLGSPTKVVESFMGSSPRGECYSANGGAIWFWMNANSLKVENITVVPDCSYQ